MGSHNEAFSYFVLPVSSGHGRFYLIDERKPDSSERCRGARGTSMYAVEFRAKIKDGIIELPKRFKESITDTVKVIILKEESPARGDGEKSEPDMIERLLASPLKIKGFHPLKRDEIYAR